MGARQSTEQLDSTTDLRFLAGTKTSASGTIYIVPTADASGCYFRSFSKRQFVYVTFETETETVLDFKGFEKIKGSSIGWSTFIVVESKAGETKFLGSIIEGESGRLFIVLFSANYSKREVKICAEYSTGFQLSEKYTTCMCKSSSGDIYSINWVKYVLKRTCFYVSRVQLTDTDELTIDVIFNSKIINGQWSIPFVEGDAVYFFPRDDLVDKLLKIPFDGSDSSIIAISCSCDSCGWKKGHLFHNDTTQSITFVFNERFYFTCEDDVHLTIWSINKIITLNKLILRLEQQLERSKDKRFPFSEWHILPDGTAFICSESRILQMDLLAPGKFRMEEKLLGKGSYGAVMKGVLKGHGDIAVKIMHNFPKQSKNVQRKYILSALAEARRLKAISHKNVIKGIGHMIEKDRFLLFMELMQESLRDKIMRSDEKRLEDKVALLYLEQALEGLVHLHTLKPKAIVHRDLKCQNLLLSDIGVVKLGDFGLVNYVLLSPAGSTDLSHAPTGVAGTPYWQAPEVLDPDAKYGRKADVWSIGCCLVEMLTGYPPYYRIEVSEWAMKIKDGTLSYSPKELVPYSTSDTISLLAMIFRRATKENTSLDPEQSQSIRLHSWEILAELQKKLSNQ